MSYETGDDAGAARGDGRSAGGEADEGALTASDGSEAYGDPQAEHREAVDVTHSPATVSAVIATAAAAAAVLATGLTSVLALGLGLFGLAGVAAGLFAFESRRAVDAGTAVVFLGVVVSGVYGTPAPLLLIGALGTVVAFDAGDNAFSVGAQLSDDTDTRRGELAHVAASVAFGVLAAAFAYGVYLALGGTEQPIAGLLFLLLGAVLLAWGVRT